MVILQQQKDQKNRILMNLNVPSSVRVFVRNFMKSSLQVHNVFDNEKLRLQV